MQRDIPKEQDEWTSIGWTWGGLGWTKFIKEGKLCCIAGNWKRKEGNKRVTEGELSCCKDGALSMVATSRLTETESLSDNTSNKASVTKV